MLHVLNKVPKMARRQTSIKSALVFIHIWHLLIVSISLFTVKHTAANLTWWIYHLFLLQFYKSDRVYRTELFWLQKPSFLEMFYKKWHHSRVVRKRRLRDGCSAHSFSVKFSGKTPFTKRFLFWIQYDSFTPINQPSSCAHKQRDNEPLFDCIRVYLSMCAMTDLFIWIGKGKHKHNITSLQVKFITVCCSVVMHCFHLPRIRLINKKSDIYIVISNKCSFLMFC